MLLQLFQQSIKSIAAEHDMTAHCCICHRYNKQAETTHYTTGFKNRLYHTSLFSSIKLLMRHKTIIACLHQKTNKTISTSYKESRRSCFHPAQ